MEQLFLKVLNMSFIAVWIVLAVVLTRFALKKAPKWITCALWTLVGVRLLFPFSLESALSLIPSTETIPQQLITSNSFNLQTGLDIIDIPVNEYLGDRYFEGVSVPADNGGTLVRALGFVWFTGIAVMLLYAAVSYLKMRSRVKASLYAGNCIRICDYIETPFILGVIKPKIYIPSGMDEVTKAHVIAHENAHLKRGDHLWKPLGFIMLAVHWFNPFVWLAYILFCRDIELACDEKVIRGLLKPDVIAYSEALLTCGVSRRMVLTCPLAFGEVGIKERIKTVLNYKKPTLWIIIAAAIICVVVAVCFLTNPKNEAEEQGAKRPALVVDGISYVNPYMPVSEMPYGYALAGTLSEEQANDTGLAGCEYYTHPNDADSFFVYQQCGTPIDEKTVDSEKLQWAYVRWIKADMEESYARLLTLDDIRFLAKKGEALTWSDFDAYSYTETGFGLYIRVYEIDERFSLRIGGGPTDESPMYLRLVSEANQDEYIDIRTEDVGAFVAAHGGFVSNVGGADEPQSVVVTEFSVPIADYTIQRAYSTWHTGIDFASEAGEPILAVANGKVVFSGVPKEGDSYESEYGQLVVIDHSDGLLSLYAHNSENLVALNEYVERGQAIALMGSTGNSTGPHLHFEIRLNNEPVEIAMVSEDNLDSYIEIRQ